MALNVSGSDSLFWKTGISTAGLEKGAMKSKGILRGLAGSITKMDVFAGLAIGSAFVFAKISKQAYNFSKEFETAMKEVQTISKAVQNDFKGISKEIIAMSKTVPDNAQKLTKALYQIVSAGYDGAEAMDILRRSTILATASVTDTFTAADVLTYVMNAYGEAAGTAADISAKLFTIVKLGKVKMEELGPTLSMVTGLAAEAGMSFNDLGAFYAEAVKKIQPHIVSTGIRGFVTALLRASKEGADAAKAAKEMGIEFDIATLKSKGLGYMLKQMSEATEGQKQKLMELFPNVRGLIGLLATMTNEGENFNKTLREIEASLGADEKAFKTMIDTTENQLAILKNNVMAKFKPLGDELLGFMNDIASGINIAMSGANDELSKLGRAYSELADTLRKKQNRIDDLITTIEDLRDKTEEGKDVTIELNAAEKALITLLPNLAKAAEDAGASFDILAAAKRGSLEESRKIMELELTLAGIAKEQARVELERFKLGEDKANKEVKKLKEEVDTWYKEISEKQTSYIRELFRTMEMYPLDPYAKQINALIEIYDGAGISVRNFGERIKDIRKDMKMGEDTTERQTELIEEVTSALFARDKGLEKTRLDLATAELKLGEAEIQLRLNVKKTTEELNIRTEAYEKFKEAISKPIITPKPESKYGEPPIIKPDKIITTITDTEVEAVKNKLNYMASQYKKFLSDVAEHGIEHVRKENILLAKEGENYSQFLSDMQEKYKGNADLNRQISDDIYEYNNGILAKRKEAEEELFNLLATDREKDLAKAKEKYNSLTEIFKEGTTERLDIEKQYRIRKEEINEEYDNKEAEARLTIFKAGWEKQIGEEREAYKVRLKAKLKMLEAEKVIDLKRVEFIRNQLGIIRILEEAEAKNKKEILKSYLSAYKTIEEKIAAINAETNKLIKIADDEITKNRLDNIRKQRIAEIKASEARQEVNKKLARYERELNNKQLEEYIKVLEKMKLKYSDFADIIILLNEKIADSQNQIWENTRDEIDKTAALLHNLAGVVGEFDTELSQMINNIANLVSGIGQIISGFASGNIFGILGGIISGISAIFNLFTVHHSDVPELQEQLHEVTLELQEQHNILSQSIGTAKTEAIVNMIALLREQINVYNEMIEAEKEAYGQFLWFTWSETDQDKIEQWLSSIQNINAEIANLSQQYQEILTGTTAEAIADAIAEGFAQGLDSAQIFADTFNNMMKKAIIDAFKRTIVTKYIEDWYNQFFILSGGLGEQLQAIFGGGWSLYEGGLTPETIAILQASFQSMLGRIETEWAAIENILAAAGIDIGEAETIEEIKEQAKEAMEAIAGITEETIADSIADGFYQGLTSAEVFADTFKDMMQRAIIDAFKKTIITRYLKSWYDQFNILSEGGFTVAEIEALAGVYQNVVNVASAQWEAMEAILEAAGIKLDEAEREGLAGAIAGITEETAGLLAGQFQAIRINTVEILSNMESIIIINSQIAENTTYNKYLESIDKKLGEGDSVESEYLRAVGGS